MIRVLFTNHTYGSNDRPHSNLSAEFAFSFECKADSGALLLLEPPGQETKINARGRIKNYMSKHFDSWVTLANERLEFDLKPEDILFVSATIKTSRWVCAAFSGSNRNKKGSLKCNLSNLAQASASLSIDEKPLAAPFRNFGPLLPRQLRPLALRPTVTSSDPSTSVLITHSSPNTDERAASGHESGTLQDGPRPSLEEPDARVRPLMDSDGRLAGSDSEIPEPAVDAPTECIFIHYFKMKRRLFRGLQLYAGAGPHELPPDDSTPDGDELAAKLVPGEWEVETNPPPRRVRLWS